MLSKEMVVVIAVIVLGALSASALLLGYALAHAFGTRWSGRVALEDAALSVGAYVFGVIAISVLKTDGEQGWIAGGALFSVAIKHVVSFRRNRAVAPASL